MLENIFSNNKNFSSYEKLEDNYKNIVQRNQFETPKRYSFKNSHKTQGNEINITQSRYEAFSDSDENDTKGCNNDNGELSNNVTASISSRQINLGNNDIKNINISIKARQKREMKRVVVLKWLLKTPKLRKLKVGSYLPKMIYLL